MCAYTDSLSLTAWLGAICGPAGTIVLLACTEQMSPKLIGRGDYRHWHLSSRIRFADVADANGHH